MTNPALLPLMVMRTWLRQITDAATAIWSARAGRERVLLIVMGVVLTAATLQICVIQPALEARSRLKAEIAELDEALARTRGLSALSESEPVSSQPAAMRLNQLAADQELDIARLQTEGSRHTVTLADAPFSTVSDWLAAVEKAPGLSITALQLERRPTPGLVSTRAEIEGQG